MDPTVDGIVAGGEDADDAVYLRHAPAMRRIAVAKFRVPLADVDNLVHDVFATYLARPLPVENLRGYLIGGICNASRQYWRRKGVEQRLFADAFEDVLHDDHVLDGLTVNLTVAATLARMDERCREILRRYYFDDETPDTISAAVNTSPGNVIYLLHICRKRARVIYEAITRAGS